MNRFISLLVLVLVVITDTAKTSISYVAVVGKDKEPIVCAVANVVAVIKRGVVPEDLLVTGTLIWLIVIVLPTGTKDMFVPALRVRAPVRLLIDVTPPPPGDELVIVIVEPTVATLIPVPASTVIAPVPALTAVTPD